MSSWWTDSYMVKPRPSRPVPALPITHWLIPYSLVTQMTLWRHDSLHSGMWYKEKMFDWTPSKWCSYSRSTGVSSVALSPIRQYLTSSLRLKIDSSVWWVKMKQKMHMDLLVYHVCGLLIFHKKKNYVSLLLLFFQRLAWILPYFIAIKFASNEFSNTICPPL